MFDPNYYKFEVSQTHYFGNVGFIKFINEHLQWMISKENDIDLVTRIEKCLDQYLAT